MSGPQFMHLETYQMSVSKLRKSREVARAEEGKIVDRKLNVEEICGEAARSPGHCPHVEAAQAPVLLHGISPDQVPPLLAERVAAANAAIRAKKAAMARGTRSSGPRAIRPDTHTLLSMVTSHPIPWHDLATGEANFDDPDNKALLDLWLQLNLSWAKLKAEVLGFELVSVVLHVDEAYPHLHFLGIPENERMEARRCHPGYGARDALEKGAGETDKQFKARKNRTYNGAMRGFQDDYFEKVSVHAGLVRTGPKRARVPRAVWQARKVEARAQGLASVRHNQLQQATEEKQKQYDETNDLLLAVGNDAAAAIIEMSEFEWQRVRAEQALAEKQSELESYEGLQIDLQALAIERAMETAALENLKRESEEAEARAALAQERADRQSSEIAAQRKEMERERNILEEDKRKFAKEMIRERTDLQRKQEEVDAVLDGVSALADGRLRFLPDNEDRPFSLTPGPDGIDESLVERLKVVKPRLVPLFRRLDEAVARRAMALGEALTAAINGWSTGLLRGLGAPRRDGKPTFDIPKTSEGDLLVKQIDPYRELVASVISVLPDLRVIRAVKRGLTRLSSRLSEIDRAEAARVEEAMSVLQQSKSAER